jgi:hypothetical protein
VLLMGHGGRQSREQTQLLSSVRHEANLEYPQDRGDSRTEPKIIRTLDRSFFVFSVPAVVLHPLLGRAILRVIWLGLWI